MNVTLPAPVLVKITAALETGLLAESLAVTVSVTGDAPVSGRVVPLAFIATVEPTICTGTRLVAPAAAAEMVTVRLLLSAPTLSLPVTTPFASATPPPLILLMNAVRSVPVENVTVLPGTVCPLTSSTTAVTSTVAAPDEGSCPALTES